LTLYIVAGLVLAIDFTSLRIIRKAIRKRYYPEKIIQTEILRSAVLQFSIFLFAIAMFLFWLDPLAGFKIGEIPEFYRLILSIFILWTMFFLLVCMTLNLYRLTDNYQMAGLCFQATLDSLRNLRENGLRTRNIHRVFKWLKLGFKSCNEMLARKPYSLVVRNVDQYCQHILSVALLGNQYDINRISTVLQHILLSLGNQEGDFNLRQFLTALLWASGRTSLISESTDILSDMILIRPSLKERILVSLRSNIVKVILFIFTVVPALASLPQLISIIQTLTH
jgi:hypothetical protein